MLTPPQTEGLDPVMEQYNASLPYDRIFYKEDIAGSIAFARANYNTGILTKDEFAAIEKGLAQVKEEWANGTFEVKANDEDIHTANERRLSEIIGKDIGGKLHTGRSRNEQVATDMRLWLREELRKLEGFLKDLIKVTVARAEREIDVLVSHPPESHLHIGGKRKKERFANQTILRFPATRTSKKPSPSAGRTGSSATPQPSPKNSNASASS